MMPRSNHWKEAARWGGIILSAVSGLLLVCVAPMNYFVTHEPPRSVSMAIVIAAAVALSVPFFIVAHSCWHRRYDRVITAAPFVVAVLVWLFRA